MVRTGILLVLAVVLAGVTWITRPSTPVLAQFSDQGEAFYPSFTDPFTATALEVVDFDPETATTKIPSSTPSPTGTQMSTATALEMTRARSRRAIRQSAM